MEAAVITEKQIIPTWGGVWNVLIVCDSKRHRVSHEVEMATRKAAHRALYDLGWRKKRGRDLCPQCANGLAGASSPPKED